MKTHTLTKQVFLTAALAMLSISAFSQTVGIDNVAGFSPTSLLHVFDGNNVFVAAANKPMVNFTGSTSMTSGTVLSLTGSNSTAGNFTGNVFSVNTNSTGTPVSGSNSTIGFVNFNFSAAHGGNGFEIDDATTGGNTMQLNANSLTTGTGLNISANAISSGFGEQISSSANFSGNLMYLHATGAPTGPALLVNDVGTSSNAIQAIGGGAVNFSAIFAQTTAAANGTGVGVATSSHTIYASIGPAASTKTYSYAIYGECLGTGVTPLGGVMGYANGYYGCLAYDNGSEWSGVYGYYSAGVYGYLARGNGIGALGQGTLYGVEGIGISSSGSTYGVYGTCTATGTTNYGVYGTASGGSTINYGVYGTSSSTTTHSAGVFGSETATSGLVEGVWGDIPNGGSGVGVVGTNEENGGAGMQALAENSLGVGIEGLGNNANSGSPYVTGNGEGGAFTGSTVGMSAFTTSTANGSAAGYFSLGGGATAWADVATRSAGTYYAITSNYTKATVIKDQTGKERIMACTEAPEILFEDYGNAKLENGKAHIEIDPVFAYSITVNEKHPLRVYIQLEGDCNGVYVTNKTTNGFDVIELKGGTSNVAFGYHVIGNRKDELDENGNCISKHADNRYPYLDEKMGENMKPKAIQAITKESLDEK